MNCLASLLVAISTATVLVFTATAARAADRVALVIGCEKYSTETFPELSTPVLDAKCVADKLRAAPMNFDVIQVLDATRNAFFEGLNEFKKRARGARVAIVYFSGHGIEFDGLNYCIPVDAVLEKPSHLDGEAIELAKILSTLKETGAEAKVAVLDACRNNPLGFSKAWRDASGKSISLGALAALGDAQLPEATLVCFSTSPGRKAAAILNQDSEHSPFTEQLLRKLNTRGARLRDIFETTADAVAQVTEQRQLPYVKYDGAAIVLRQLVLVPDHGLKGRLITSVKPHLEFLVTKDRKVEITTLTEDLKATKMSGQVIAVTAGDRSNPTKLELKDDGGKLVSSNALPAGNDFPVSVNIKPGAGGKTTYEKFNLNLEKCPTCGNGEYACVCDDTALQKKKQARKRGFSGRLITAVEPPLEFLVTKERKVEITALTEDLKAAKMSGQVISVTAGDRASPTKLQFEEINGKLVSSNTLPEGDDFPVSVSIKRSAVSKAVYEKFPFCTQKCPSCGNAEYACKRDRPGCLKEE